MPRLTLILGGAACLYVGIWEMFAPGVVRVVLAVRAPELVWSDIGWGILQVLCTGLAMLLTALPFMALDLYLSERKNGHTR